MLTVALAVIIFLMTVVLHEVGHGVAAYAFGDPTAKRAGRLTLNPLRHIDPFWTVFLPLLMFISTQGHFAIGSAKPVPVDFSRLHHPKQNMIWVGAAGPGVNILLAFLFSLVWKAAGGQLFLYAVWFNLGLAMFNLIPIPPLDGSRIVAGFLPGPLAAGYLRIEPYGFAVILFLYFTGALLQVVYPAVTFFCRLLGVPQIS